MTGRREALVVKRLVFLACLLPLDFRRRFGMHREFDPHAMAFAQGGHHPGDHAHDDHHHERETRSLFALTAVLGVLLCLDLVLGALGWESLRVPWAGISLAQIAAVLGALRIVYTALETLSQGRIGADLALAQACIAALLLGEPFVAAEVVFIALLGEVLEAVTYLRAQKSITRLLDQAPRTARVRREPEDEGQPREIEIPIGQVRVGDLVLVGPGEKIAVDGTIRAGRSTIDRSNLTGESTPIDVGPGDPVFSSTLNQFGRIEVLAEKVGQETTYGQVLRLVAQAQSRKAPLERAADRYARYFLPVVEIAALATWLAGWWLGWPDVWYRVVAVLVVACPCALVLATPAAVLASMAWLARHGVIIKGGVALERLATCDTIAFDKTGTLTLGRPELALILPRSGEDEESLLRLAATAEQDNQHPLARALVRSARERGLVIERVGEVETLPGAGVKAIVPLGDGDHMTVLVGNQRLLTEAGLSSDDESHTDVRDALRTLDEQGATPLFLAVNGRILGLMGLRDTIRPEAHDIIHQLKHLGVKTLAILTGDRAAAAAWVGKKVHIKTVEAEQLPADKARWIHARQQAGHRVAMIGDGINDAPALARADVGIALGAMGSDLAAEAGDVVLLGDPLRTLPQFLELSRATVRVIRQNIIGFAFGLNILAVGSAMLGVLGPVAAAVLHQVGSLLVLLNSMRLLAFGDWRTSRPAQLARDALATARRFDEWVDPETWLKHARKHAGVGITLTVLGLATLAATSGWVAIGPDEVGLVRRLGESETILQPGPHLRWPWPIESVTRIAPARVRVLELGFRSTRRVDVPASLVDSRLTTSSRDSSPPARLEEESLLLTGDGQFVELTAVLSYSVRSDAESLQAHAYRVRDPEAVLRGLAEAELRSQVSHSSLENLLTAGRVEIERASLPAIQRRADVLALGILLQRLALLEARPPSPVLDAYREIARADAYQQQQVNLATAAQFGLAQQAKARSTAILARAHGQARGRIALSRTQATNFLGWSRVREPHPVLTDLQRFWSRVTSALRDQPIIVIDPSRLPARRHLILADPTVSIPSSALDSRRPLTPPLSTDRPPTVVGSPVP